MILAVRLYCKACNFIKKETPKQVLSCEYCEIFKNSFFYRTPPVAPSKIRQFCTLYLCYAFFSKPFKVFFPAAKIYNFKNITNHNKICLLWGLLLTPGPRPWTQPLKNLDSEKPGSWKTRETVGFKKKVWVSANMIEITNFYVNFQEKCFN